MKRLVGLVLGTLALASCRGYDYYSHLADDGGKTPADQFARYGREQAQLVAVGRELARAHRGGSPEDYAAQTEAAVRYAKSLPDVTEVRADTLGHWITVRFKSGWRVATNPIDDGKSGAETPGVGAGAGAATAR